MECPTSDLALDAEASLPEQMGSSEPHLQYTSFAAPDHIRLLRIIAPTSEEIAISLEEVKLNDDIAYECLSYTWDGPKDGDVGDHWTTNHRRIVCNSAVTYIRQNLYDGLVQLRNSNILGPIWIDALCINQGDISERNSQVAQMGEIYKRATRVVVWLGKEDMYTKTALESLERSTLTLEDYERDKSSSLREHRRCQYTYDEDCAILYFMVQRSWYSRLWIVQEIVLARDIIFFCGPHNAPIDTIWRGCLFIQYSDPDIPDDHNNLTEADFSFSFLAVCMFRHKRIRSPILNAIGDTIHLFRHAKSTDARDKVFGLLAISDCYNYHLRTTMKADYNIPIQQVYTSAAKFALCDSQNLAALAAVGDQSLNQIISLPSWVPDLSVSQSLPPLEYLDSRFAAASQEPYRLDWQDNALILDGLLWDRINVSSESESEIANGEGISHLLQVFNECGLPYVHSDDLLAKAIQRIFVADKLSQISLHKLSAMEGKYDIEGAFEKLFFGIICFALYKAGQMVILERFREDPETILRTSNANTGETASSEGLASIFHRGKVKWDNEPANFMSRTDYKGGIFEALDCDQDPFAGSWHYRFKSRRYFRTSRGYLGLGLRQVRPGDAIYLIKGASVPYVFRPLSENPADGYIFVGEVYVHGIMYGEALAAGTVNFKRMEIH